MEDGGEGFLGDVDAADAFHAAFAGFLGFEELFLAGDVAAVALGEDVLAEGADGFAGDDAGADGGLDCDFEELAGDFAADAEREVAADDGGLLAKDEG